MHYFIWWTNNPSKGTANLKSLKIIVLYIFFDFRISQLLTRSAVSGTSISTRAMVTPTEWCLYNNNNNSSQNSNNNTEIIVNSFATIANMPSAPWVPCIVSPAAHLKSHFAVRILSYSIKNLIAKFHAIIWVFYSTFGETWNFRIEIFKFNNEIFEKKLQDEWNFQNFKIVTRNLNFYINWLFAMYVLKYIIRANMQWGCIAS